MCKYNLFSIRRWIKIPCQVWRQLIVAKCWRYLLQLYPRSLQKSLHLSGCWQRHFQNSHVLEVKYEFAPSRSDKIFSFFWNLFNTPFTRRVCWSPDEKCWSVHPFFGTEESVWCLVLDANANAEMYTLMPSFNEKNQLIHASLFSCLCLIWMCNKEFSWLQNWFACCRRTVAHCFVLIESRKTTNASSRRLLYGYPIVWALFKILACRDCLTNIFVIGNRGWFHNLERSSFALVKWFSSCRFCW